MSDKNIKNVETEEIVEVEVVEETTKEGFGTKVVDWCKKHGKKIGVGAAIGLVAAVTGYKVGKGTKHSSDCDDYDYDDQAADVDVDVTEF